MKNRKNLTRALGVLMGAAMTISLAGCGSSTPVTDSETAEQPSNQVASVQEETSTEEVSEAASVAVSEADAEETLAKEPEIKLPAYEYPGPELFYYILYQYMVDELGSKFDDYEVCIPNPMIVDIDESDKSDIKVYGDFWVDNYNLEGDTLMSVSGGSFPGIIHIKADDAGYEVTGMDVVADGSDYMESAKEIFGDRYDAFVAITADQDAREANRAQIVANYVAVNELNITQYQDYGWDPVTLPEENIDNFYGDLN